MQYNSNNKTTFGTVQTTEADGQEKVTAAKTNFLKDELSDLLKVTPDPLKMHILFFHMQSTISNGHEIYLPLWRFEPRTSVTFYTYNAMHFTQLADNN